MMAAGVVIPATSAAAAPTITLTPTAPVAGQAFTVKVAGLTAGTQYSVPLTATSANDLANLADSNSCATPAAAAADGTLTCTITETTKGDYQLKVRSATATEFSSAVTVNDSVASVTAPRVADTPGSTADVITVYKTPGVATWTVQGGTPITLGANESSRDVTITHGSGASTDVKVLATAAPGYVLADGKTTQEWTLRATTAAQVPAALTVTEPTKADPAGSANDALTFTSTPNVTWTMNGAPVTFGSGSTVTVNVPSTVTRDANGKATVTVVATAAEGQTFGNGASTRTFTYEFTSARSEPSITRVQGSDRFETAVEIAKKYFPGQRDTVYVANGMNFPDALAAGPAAASAKAPLMLTASGSVKPSVLAEIRRMQPKNIRIVGGTAAVNADVEKQLAEIATVSRIQGADRFATAAKVSAGRSAGGTVYIASGMNFPDALAGGSGAAREGAAMLLTDGRTLTDETVVELRRLAPKKVVLVGGDDVVRTSVARQVGDIVGNVQIDRAGGSDRFATSALIIENVTGKPVDNKAPTSAFLATGLNYPDALAGIPAAHSVNAPLALTLRQCLPTSVKTQLDKLPLTETVRLGSSNIVGDFSALTGGC